MTDIGSFVLVLPSATAWLTVALAIVLLGRPTVTFFERSRSPLAIAGSGLAFGVALAAMFTITSRNSEFLYFNF